MGQHCHLLHPLHVKTPKSHMTPLTHQISHNHNPSSPPSNHTTSQTSKPCHVLTWPPVGRSDNTVNRSVAGPAYINVLVSSWVYTTEGMPAKNTSHDSQLAVTWQSHACKKHVTRQSHGSHMPARNTLHGSQRANRQDSPTPDTSASNKGRLAGVYKLKFSVKSAAIACSSLGAGFQSQQGSSLLKLTHQC
jgi:hypothetical protein